jgi:hypothetical protein
VQGSIHVDWNKTILISRSTPTLQVVVNPMVRPSSPIHDAAFRALKDLGADYVRYVPWLPYPRLAVAEMAPPEKNGTSWDFSLIDPMVQDFVAATDGHPTVMNFSTIPEWLFVSPRPVAYPDDPNQVFWDYSQGTELRDPTGKELGDYYARLVSWYTNGEFTDEVGRKHVSGHRHKIPIWEVLNEVEFEHKMAPEFYCLAYDSVVEAVRRVSPQTKFMGLALAMPSQEPEYFEYFLNPSHHRPGVPIDYISYHFYAVPEVGETPDSWQYTLFDQADRFLATVRYVETIRKRLSPSTRTDIDELGVILPGDPGSSPDHPDEVIPDSYWNAAGALYAYLYVELAKQGIEIIGESQLVGYPTQFPSVTMVDWRNGRPNARYWVLKLIRDNFGPGDRLVETNIKTADETSGTSDVWAQAFVTPAGDRLLLVNRRNRTIPLRLPSDPRSPSLATVDGLTGGDAPRTSEARSDVVVLPPYAVAVASWNTVQAARPEPR